MRMDSSFQGTARDELFIGLFCVTHRMPFRFGERLEFGFARGLTSRYPVGLRREGVCSTPAGILTSNALKATYPMPVLQPAAGLDSQQPVLRPAAEQHEQKSHSPKEQSQEEEQRLLFRTGHVSVC
ncbi:hypothetical protein F2P81_002278 [Scophthalmus maximus]|uniref:Uncharacterized protein n=1 Tax=Scophthalmus maximus TaxID=52904 RepID=A0A6A4TLM8_SCOMX|nr:hypothetical protein F2P81_002278 [Scophthalmus maximus]